MILEKKLRSRLEINKILLMTHIVLGYPSMAVNRQVIEQMVAAVSTASRCRSPFPSLWPMGRSSSRPIRTALPPAPRSPTAWPLVQRWPHRYDIPFLFMTYYNIIFKYGEEKFFKDCRSAGIVGLIVPDLPPEMGENFFKLAGKYQVAPVLIFAPTSTDARMAELNKSASGFIYCVARRGVTGKQSEFGKDFNTYLSRCRAATSLPLAVGFGIRNREDVAAITGQADMAVIGSETIRLVDAQGPEAVGPFISSLR